MRVDNAAVRGRARIVVGDSHVVIPFLAMFSGAALLLNIILNINLGIGLVVITAGVGAAFLFTLRRAGTSGRRTIARTLMFGAVSGVVGTLAYDTARTLLAMVDGSSYQPFEAIIRFGQLLLGTGARDGGVVLAGALFHVLNGASFGVAFAFAFARGGDVSLRRIVLLGMAWGMFLEVFQILLYPQWLGIKYVREFVTISALGHLAYGGTMGPLVRALLRRSAAGGLPGHAIEKEVDRG